MDYRADDHANAAIESAAVAHNFSVNQLDERPELAAAVAQAGIASALAAMVFELGRHNDLLAKIHGIPEDD